MTQFLQKWQTAKRAFEARTGQKKPAHKVLKVFNASSGLEKSLANCDTADRLADAVLGKYVKQFDDAAKKFAQAADGYAAVLDVAIRKSLQDADERSSHDTSDADSDGDLPEYAQACDALKTSLHGLKNEMQQSLTEYAARLTELQKGRREVAAKIAKVREKAELAQERTDNVQRLRMPTADDIRTLVVTNTQFVEALNQAKQHLRSCPDMRMWEPYAPTEADALSAEVNAWTAKLKALEKAVARTPAGQKPDVVVLKDYQKTIKSVLTYAKKA